MTYQLRSGTTLTFLNPSDESIKKILAEADLPFAAFGTIWRLRDITHDNLGYGIAAKLIFQEAVPVKPEPKFKIGDIVRVNCLPSPRYAYTKLQLGDVAQVHSDGFVDVLFVPHTYLIHQNDLDLVMRKEPQ
jgi:hypothetical protein